MYEHRKCVGDTDVLLNDQLKAEMAVFKSKFPWVTIFPTIEHNSGKKSHMVM